eukprot:CAMPEP_0197890518 /NCGR_PEP_ID=MMETSP1439-20131203/26992_1 /TAXON_ID=66791 /ORGANISM="Gonyaulax spinifera, Strain CCMP409" /LENGTH=189 /DNA_ID=CAMNT_0043510563 /DNA_START=222 /DNA_END=788 /DNA_ORIENTATION=+
MTHLSKTRRGGKRDPKRTSGTEVQSTTISSAPRSSNARYPSSAGLDHTDSSGSTPQMTGDDEDPGEVQQTGEAGSRVGAPEFTEVTAPALARDHLEDSVPSGHSFEFGLPDLVRTITKEWRQGRSGHPYTTVLEADWGIDILPVEVCLTDTGDVQYAESQASDSGGHQGSTPPPVSCTFRAVLCPVVRR